MTMHILSKSLTYMVCVFVMTFVSCTNTYIEKSTQATDDVNKTDGFTTDTIQICETTINSAVNSDSLDEWLPTSPNSAVYYKDVMLTMQIVEIDNSQLKLYLSNYIVPLVKRKGFDIKNNFIIVQYIKSESGNKQVAQIHILVDYCGITHRFAKEIYEGKYRVAFIDNIPVLFKDFNDEVFIRNSSGIYEYRKWRKDFIWLMVCDLETEFYFIVKNGTLLYTGYEDWGLNLVKSEDDMPEVWNSEQNQQSVGLSCDTVLEENNPIKLMRKYELPQE